MGLCYNKGKLSQVHSIEPDFHLAKGRTRQNRRGNKEVLRGAEDKTTVSWAREGWWGSWWQRRGGGRLVSQATDTPSPLPGKNMEITKAFSGLRFA